MKILAIILALLLVGCASTEMKSYIGKDIREVILINGQPIGAIDMGNGIRAFQFMWGGTTATAMSTQNNSSLSMKGSDGWLRKGEIASSGSALITNGCVVAYLTKWDEVQGAWLVF